MGSNGGLGTSSRTSSSYSSSGLHQHIISETNDLSDDNPICDEPLVTSIEGCGLEGHFDDDDDETKHEGEDVDEEEGQNSRDGRGQNGGRCADEATAIDALTLTKQDFLVSFMVDARGGSMKGCRYSGVKVSYAILFVFDIFTYASSLVWNELTSQLESIRVTRF